MNTLEHLLKGDIEYTCTYNSEQHVKDIIAFANTNGGKLIIGIKDQTLEIVGIEKDDLFRIMDRITNTLSDVCEPQLMPSIDFITVDKKSLIVVEVYPGNNRPYYIKSKGERAGTYVRICGTSRLAQPTKLQELRLEGANLSWDEQICMNYELTDEAIHKLCLDIQNYASNNDTTIQQSVTIKQLVNWNVLKYVNDKLVATNAFALLTSTYFRFSKIQCALFKGKDRDIFIDKKEYTGPLYEQIEHAYKFVLTHINLSATINGLFRKEAYELPIGAIREMIVNSITHRNYMDESCIQVSIFDDRLEVTSHGSLYGLSLEEALEGRSRIRNRAIAEVFSRMELIEEWGTGLQRIMKRAVEYDLPTPIFSEKGETFRVILYRKPIDASAINSGDKSFEHFKTILSCMQDDEEYTSAQLGELLNLQPSRMRELLKELVLMNKIDALGGNRNRRYKLK